MPLLNRLSRLLRADANAMLDLLEEPAEMLRQSMREMEDMVHADERRLAQLEVDQKALERREGELEQVGASLAAELELCLAEDADDLARTVVRRQLETNALLAQVTRQRRCANEESAELNARVSERRTKLAHLQHKADVLLQEAEVAPPGIDSNAFSATEDDIEIALLRAKSARAAS